MAIYLIMRAITLIGKANARLHGVAVEKRSVNKAKKALKGYDANEGPLINGAGNIDMIITCKGYSSHKWVVEIKSWHGLRESKGQIVKMNGGKPFGSPIHQVKYCARQISKGRPMLWLPMSKKESHFYFDDVLIVNGNAIYLNEVLNSLQH